MTRRLMVVALLLVALACRAEVVEELVQLPSAGDAHQPVLITHDDGQPTAALAVLFSGGDGQVGLQKSFPRPDGHAAVFPHPNGNFLVRSRSLFAGRGVATAVVDVPADQHSFDDAFRMSRRHVADVREVVNELRRRFPGAPVYLVGTSRGTVSAAYAGAALGDAIDGVVLTSTVVNSTRGGPGVSAFDWKSIHTRLLFVHHIDDGCKSTPYAQVRSVATGRTLITAHGGDPARSDPCEPFSAHGYLGIEAPVVDAIVQWIRGGTPPVDVP